MKTMALMALMMSLCAAGAQAATRIDFNNTSDLTTHFVSANPIYTNVASGGLSTSGCVAIQNANVTDIWTTKGQISLVAGITNVVSAYFYNFANSGYGSLGFAVGMTNSAPLAQKATPYSALGMSFHSGGGEFENNTASEKNPHSIANWTGGSLSLGQWYKFTYSLVYRGDNVFDATFLIQTADTNGTILGTQTFESQPGMTNSTVGAASILYVYFGNDGERMSAMDDFTSDAQIPLGGGIALATNSLSFNSTYQGGNPAAQMVAMTNVGGSGFTFTNVVTYGAGATGWLTVAPTSGVVALGGATALTNHVTISGINAGTHSATVTVTSADATNSPRPYAVTLTVDEATQSINFPAIAAQVVTNHVGLSATADSGLAVSFAVGSGPADIAEGTNLTFSGAGQVSIVASQEGDTNYNAAPDVTNTFSVSKATALVTLTDLIQTYDGTARVVGYTSDPSVSSVLLTYDGNAWAPTNAGSYAVTGTVNDIVYQGSAVNTLLVGQASQSITFPAIGRKHVSESVGLAATASSGLTVTFAAVGPATINSGTNLTFSGVGDVSVIASQSGNSNYDPAPSVTNLVPVYDLLPATGPSTGGNMITITNGNFGAVTNVLVDGVPAAIQSLDANWVTFTIPTGLTPGAKDIVIQTSDQGDTTLPNAYTVNPPGTIYSGHASSWTNIMGLSEARYAVAVAEFSNSLYVIGGATGTWGSAVAKTNVYRFDGANWTEAAGLPTNRYLSGAAVYSGQVYVVGGYDTSERTNVYRFDGTTWTEIVGLPTAEGRAGPAVCVWSNHLYSIAGSPDKPSSAPSTNVFRFNGTAWEEVRSLPTPSYAMVAGVLDGVMYAAGGFYYGYRTNCYRYDGADWIPVSGLPTGLVFAGGAVLDNHLYAIGGETVGGAASAEVYRFDGTAWTLDSSLPAARDNIGAGVMNSAIFAVGGRSSGTGATNVYRYSLFDSFGVSPSSGVYTGGYQVVITGTNLCDGSDVTNVTLCGVNVSGITGKSATQIVVTAGAAGGAVTGDVRVFSTSFGETVKSNAFAYLAPELAVLGTNGAVVASGNTASWTDGTKFRPTLLGTARTHTFSIANNGNTALNISGYTTNGTDTSLFAADGVPTVVAAGGVSNFTVVYTPASFGSHSVSVEFTGDAPASPFTLNLGGSCFGVSTNIGPYAGGNTITITNGNFGSITNVLVGGVAAAIHGSAANWVTLTIPAGLTPGAKDIVIQTSDQGDTILSQTYVVNAAGYIYKIPDWSRWEEVAALPAARSALGAGVLDGALYSVGGWPLMTNVYRYDGTNWLEVAGLPAARANVAVGVLNGALYSVGGWDSDYMTNMYRYDGTNWLEVAGLPAVRANLAVGVLNGALYSVGGASDGVRTNVYHYDGNNWSEVAGLPSALQWLSVGALNGALYAVGGSPATTNVYRYDQTNWTGVAGLPEPRQGQAVGVLNGALYAIGGSTTFGGSPQTNVYRYNGTNWTETVGLPAPRADLAAGVLNGELYAIGGLSDGGNEANVFRYPRLAPDVSPWFGSFTGGYPVVIGGTNLGNGSDVTNVTLCGVSAASISSQSATQIVVVAGLSSFAGLGDVRVYSVSFGETVQSNAFTYAAPAISVSVSPFNNVIVGRSATNIFTVTNSGSLPLTVSAWTNDGIGAEYFELIDPPTSVSPGTASNFAIVFHPGAEGTFDPTCYTVNNSLTPNYAFALHGQTCQLSTNVGPSSGGNTITITNSAFGTITNVLVGGVAATIQDFGADWVSFTIPSGLTPGAKDIVVQTSDTGDITLAGAYTVNPVGTISGFTDWLRWQEMAGLPAARYLHAGAVLNDDLYAVGGRDDSGVTVTNAYRFNGTNWTEVAGLPGERERLAAGVLNGALYAVGGRDETWAVSTNAYRYDGTSWTEVAGLPAAREDLAAGVMNDALYAVGGYNGSVRTNVYGHDGTNWSEAAGLRASRRALAAGVLNGELYAVGGLDGSSAAKTNAYRYDGTSWTEIAGLPAARYGLAAGTLNDALYAIGGFNSANAQSTNVYRYDGTNWTETAGLPGARGSLAAGVLNGELYAVGGLDTNGATMTNVFRYPFTAQAVTPAYGSRTGGYEVVIVGVNLGDGGDITNVTLCGANAVVDSQSATQIVVVAGAGIPGLGDVRVCSVSFGTTVKSNAFTYTTIDATLTIVSPHGTGTPAVGIYTNLIGSVLTNLITSSDPQGTTQYVCSGWALTGNEPASGTTNLCVVTLTNDATLTWLWTTNYWLETEAGLHGSINVGAGWQASGATTSITAAADSYYHFNNWTGDASGDANPLDLLMDSPKSVTANFAENMAANGTPEWWLASYGWSNDFDNAALADQDGDLMPTWEEYRSDTTPTNEDSFLRLIVIQTEGGSMVRWAGGIGVTQYLEGNTDLLDSGSWTTLFTNAPPTPVTNEWPLATPDDNAYYRIRAVR